MTPPSQKRTIPEPPPSRAIRLLVVHHSRDPESSAEKSPTAPEVCATIGQSRLSGLEMRRGRPCMLDFMHLLSLQAEEEK